MRSKELTDLMAGLIGVPQGLDYDPPHRQVFLLKFWIEIDTK
jgi:hypothetical protein